MDYRWSAFRGWVHNLWIQNCDEHASMAQPTLTKQAYFRKFRWWIKREYRRHLELETQRHRRQLMQPPG